MNIAQHIDSRPITDHSLSFTHLYPNEEIDWEEGAEHIKVMEEIVQEALAKGASDIYLQGFKDSMDVMFRINGKSVLQRSLPVGESSMILAGFYHKIGREQGVDPEFAAISPWGAAIEDVLPTGAIKIFCGLALSYPHGFVFMCRLLERPNQK
ncbi:hypothetical protein [Pseudomonas sp. Leaf58]|uniref:hypothetical protein n=1 Tax=Pseudomonas sp. Leaf58 TaxID=1736226 RepID=UPI0006F985AD|nr:hypothetical protein [Pseudomonas sp. Leaf58]KQN62238.1 hypothetical protein ASF02_08730 [Pseudomonas sp. Leaf58]